MSVIPRSYEAAIRLLRAASPLFARGSSKLATGIRGRASSGERLGDWAEMHRDTDRPLVWTHAPSVGEALQARASLDALIRLRPHLQGVFTFFSPSAERTAERMPVDVAAYLPWDVKSEMAVRLAETQPDLISFTKTEVWPGLIAAATERHVPAVLTAATLPERAGRMRPAARWALRPTFGALDRVLAIAEDDADRFCHLGVRRDAVSVTGDPGVDAARARAQGANPSSPHLEAFVGVERPIIVAGSTWESDESVLIPALSSILEGAPRGSTARPLTVVAPHEPHDDHLAELERRLAKRSMRAHRLAHVESEGLSADLDVVIVDRVGVLAELYTVGDVAYVGGGFHGEGLHSVLEPASAGLPTAFGPRHHNARAAMDLIEIGGAESTVDMPALRRVLEGWLNDHERRAEAGARASEYIERHRGAAMRTATVLAEYLPQSDRSEP